ncbi:hypothetical protein F5Y07DRAFT_127126 [Xylaria sp. FL0933]|nr:hypothetical protein F5Y07DRAFT_127126 [Xylaria sp. FL0933]
MEALLSTARRNAPLLITLSETENAPAALDQTDRHLADIDGALRQSQNSSRNIGKEMTNVSQRLKKYQSRGIGQLIHGIIHHEAKSEAEIQRTEERREELRQIYDEGNRLIKELNNTRDIVLSEQRRLREVCERRVTALEEFDALYTSMFHDAPSLSTEIDEAEGKVESARLAYEHFRAKREESLAVERLLKQAAQSIHTARSYFKQIPNGLKFCIYKKTVVDQMVTLALMNVLTHVSRAWGSVSGAQTLSKQVGQLPPFSVPQGYTLGDEHIRDLRREFERLRRALQTEVVRATERAYYLGQRVTTRSKLLKDAKEELLREKVKLVRFLADGDSGNMAPPPPYSVDDYMSVPPTEEEEES